MKSCIFRLSLFVTIFALLAVVFGNATLAQDPGQPPTYGTVNLKAGFTPDPFTKVVTPGGPIHTNLGEVSAYVAKAPDLRVNYTAGKGPLTFHVASSADTTLLVNLPDGKWLANDDSSGNLNPKIRLANPPSGQYDIWVGTVQVKSVKSADISTSAVLHVTGQTDPPPPVTTITGTITLNPNTGKPAGNGQIKVHLSRLASSKPVEKWVELGSQTLPVKMGENDKGPWKYTIKVSLPVPVPSKTAPAKSMQPVAVFARYTGPWSVSTGGGPIRAASPAFNLKIGKTNVVDLVLKAEIIN